MSILIDRVLATRPTNLFGYWPLNGNANDLSGAGRHGSPAVQITWGRPGVGDGETAAGFNGVNSYISLPVASAPFSSITWSMMVYFRAQSWIGGLERRMLRLQFNVANPNVHIMPTKTAADNQVAIGNFTYRIEDNNWHSLIVVRSGFSYVRYYIDNALIVQRSPYALSGSELLMGVIGAHTTSPTLSWLGDLAHIAVWAGRALTDEEVQELTAWRPTITDRTQEDITNKTTKAYWNLADWERVTFNTNMVRARIATLGGLETPLHELATPTMSTYPRAQDINHLIDNIQRVRAGAAVPLAPLRRDYESGLGAVVPDYTAANEWERVLEALRFAVPHAARCFVSCGVATAGQSRPWQSQFRG